MNFRDAAIKDIKQIEYLLKECTLPTNDIKDYIDNFVIAEQDKEIIATAGFERYGEIVLIRSIAVKQKYRGKYIGNRLFKMLESKFRSENIKVLYLLTENATEYFKNLGFAVKERESVPDVITQTKQFKGLCPASATLMYCNL